MVMSDRIAIMNRGQFEQIAVAEEIYDRPNSRFVAEFMGEVNLFDVEGTAQRRVARPWCRNPHQRRGLGVRHDAGAGQSRRADGAARIHPLSSRRARPATSSCAASCAASMRWDRAFNTRSRPPTAHRLTVEKLREDRFAGGLGEEVVLGWDLEHSHMIHEG